MMDLFMKLQITILTISIFTSSCRGFINQAAIASGAGATAGGQAVLAAGLAAGLTPMQYARLTQAVKEVVGPHANPDFALIAYASQRGGPPATMFQMLGYVPYLQNIARTVGLQPAVGAKTGLTLGQPGITRQNTDAIVMQRSVQWIMKNAAAAAMQTAMLA